MPHWILATRTNRKDLTNAVIRFGYNGSTVHCLTASASRCQAKPSKPGHTCKRAARTRSQDAPIANRPADIVDSMAKGLRLVFWRLERSLAAVRLVWHCATRGYSQRFMRNATPLESSPTALHT